MGPRSSLNELNWTKMVKRLSDKTLMMFFARRAVSAFLYYGMTVSGFNPGEDAYLNFFLSGVAVIVSSASTTFILRR